MTVGQVETFSVSAFLQDLLTLPPRLFDDAGILQNKPKCLWLSAGLILLASLAFGLCASLGSGTLGFAPVLESSMLFGILVLGISLAWTLLQQYSGWFWDARLPFGQTLILSYFCVFYYAAALMASVPIIALLKSAQWPLWIETELQALLFIFNLLAAWASLRLFARRYQTRCGLPRKKSWGVTVFAGVVLVVLYSLTQVMAWMAAQHHG